MSKPTFHIAKTQAEKEAIYRLRYQIYIEEMHLFEDVADNENKLFSEQLDDGARLLYAKIDDQVMGVMRVHLGKDAPLPKEFDETYDLSRFKGVVDESALAVITRFMVHKTQRGGLLTFLFMREVAKLGVEEKINITLCDCQPHLLNLYHKVGFRCYQQPVYNDPHFGIIVPLLMILNDSSYFHAIGSPLTNIFDHSDLAVLSSERIAALVGTPSVTPIIDPKENSFELLTNHETTRFLDGLAPEEVESITSQGNIINCLANDRVIMRNQIAKTIFLVLDGSLIVEDAHGFRSTKSEGEIVGEVAFLLDSKRIADVFAGPEGVSVLSLNESTVKSFIETPSTASAKLLLNLSKMLAAKLSEKTLTPA